MAIDWNKIRQSYKVFEKYTYLLTNAGAPISNEYLHNAIEHLSQYNEKGRLVTADWKREMESARIKLAKLINSDADEIAFITSVTAGMNLLTGLFPTDFDIITMRDDFPACFVNWIHNGHRVSFVESTNGIISFDSIIEKINPETRILITSHVMYKSGFCQDLERIGRLCRENNLIHIVDATQSFGVKPIDVKKYNIDILLFHGYKWAASGYGVGCMYVSKNIMKAYEPKMIGWNSVQYDHPDFYLAKDLSKFKLKTNARVFEGGNMSYFNISLMDQSLDFFVNTDISKIQIYINSLVLYLHQCCKKSGVEVLSDFAYQNLSGIQILKITQKQFKAIVQAQILARFKDSKLTVALSFYNNKQDIDKLMRVLAI